MLLWLLLWMILLEMLLLLHMMGQLMVLLWIKLRMVMGWMLLLSVLLWVLLRWELLLLRLLARRRRWVESHLLQLLDGRPVGGDRRLWSGGAARKWWVRLRRGWRRRMRCRRGQVGWMRRQTQVRRLHGRRIRLLTSWLTHGAIGKAVLVRRRKRWPELLLIIRMLRRHVDTSRIRVILTGHLHYLLWVKRNIM